MAFFAFFILVGLLVKGGMIVATSWVFTAYPAAEEKTARLQHAKAPVSQPMVSRPGSPQRAELSDSPYGGTRQKFG